MDSGKALTGMSVNRATNALEVKHRTQTTAKPATCGQQVVAFTQPNKTTTMKKRRKKRAK